MKASNVAVILAGGKSSRLFPFNKVLSDFTGTGRTLIQQTKDRLKAFPKNGIYALTTSDMVEPVKRQLRLPGSHILVDPVRRGTWPAILWAMVHLRQRGSETLLAVLPGDHAIQNGSAYQKAVLQAMETARAQPAIVMIGITPEPDPNTWRGLGCFRVDRERRIQQFREKPEPDMVRGMVLDGGWYWNSGMFFFRISVAEKALQAFQPEMHRIYVAMAHALERHNPAEAAQLFEKFPEKIPYSLEFGRMVDNTIDYAIMTPLVAHPESGLEARGVVRVGFRWTDLGQWSALKSVVRADRRGNIRIGNVKVGPDVKESILVADRGHRIEITHGNGLIVAFSGQRALILPVSDVAHVKEVVKTAGPDTAIVGSKPYPGYFNLTQRGKLAVLSNKTKESL